MVVISLSINQLINELVHFGDLMNDPGEKDLKREIVRLIEEEFGRWLDENEDLIVQKIPERSKIFLMFCGSIVKGFIGEGCDLDFSVVIGDAIERPKIRGKLSREYVQFVNKLNEKIRSYGLDHVCGISRKLRTTSYLLGFENCKNPQFRVNYFLFGKIIRPNVKRDDQKKISYN